MREILSNIKNWLNDRRGERLFHQALLYFDWERDHRGEQYPELDRYDDDSTVEPKWVVIHEIVVETERDKEQILAASRYIHDLLELDTGYIGVNYIAHLYTNPDLIKVRTKEIS